MHISTSHLHVLRLSTYHACVITSLIVLYSTRVHTCSQENKAPNSSLVWSEEWDLPIKNMWVNKSNDTFDWCEEEIRARNKLVRDQIASTLKGCKQLPVSHMCHAACFCRYAYLSCPALPTLGASSTETI